MACIINFTTSYLRRRTELCRSPWRALIETYIALYDVVFIIRASELGFPRFSEKFAAFEEFRRNFSEADKAGIGNTIEHISVTNLSFILGKALVSFKLELCFYL